MKKLILMMVMILGCSLCSCEKVEKGNRIDEEVANGAENKENSMRELSERQKEILRSMDLPDNYNSLTNRQKTSIIAIEDMMVYLENKYEKKFIYDGYVADGVDGEYLTAICEDDPYGRIITVNRLVDKNDFKYEDDFQNILIHDEYVGEIVKHIDETSTVDRCFVEIDIFSTDYDQDVVFKKADADSLIFIENVLGGKEETEKYIEDFVNWMCNSGAHFPFNVNFYLQSKEDLKDTSLYTYKEKIEAGDYVYRYECSVSEDGKISIIGE